MRFSANTINADEEDEQSEGESSIRLRRNEVETLITQICDKKGVERTGSNRPSYTILLGDYNLNLKASDNPNPYLQEYYDIVDGPLVKRYRTVQNQKTTLKQNAEAGSDIDKYANNYDHFTFNETRLVNQLGIELVANRIDTLNGYCDGDVFKHRVEISDHVPSLLEMSF